MLHVSKDGATELGKGYRFHKFESIVQSVPTESSGLPNGIFILLRLMITHELLSVRVRSWAKIFV